MERAVLDAATLGKLPRMNQAIELFDESGQLLGHFLPRVAGSEDEISSEELRRREAEPGGYTTREVLEYLGKL